MQCGEPTPADRSPGFVFAHAVTDQDAQRLAIRGVAGLQFVNRQGARRGGCVHLCLLFAVSIRLHRKGTAQDPVWG